MEILLTAASVSLSGWPHNDPFRKRNYSMIIKLNHFFDIPVPLSIWECTCQDGVARGKEEARLRAKTRQTCYGTHSYYVLPESKRALRCCCQPVGHLDYAYGDSAYNEMILDRIFKRPTLLYRPAARHPVDPHWHHPKYQSIDRVDQIPQRKPERSRRAYENLKRDR